MAYIKPEEETEQQGANQTLGQTQNEVETPQTVSGASVSTSTPTQTATAAPSTSGSMSTTPSPTARSGIYTNLQDYISQNENAAQNMAGEATKEIDTQASQIGEQVKQQKSDFMSKVAENRAKLQQAGQTAQQQIQQAGQQEFDPASIQQTQQLATGQYQMEDPTFDISQQQQGADDISRLSDISQTQQGRRELLTKAFRSPEQSYTQGQRSLDELIVSGDAGARQQIAQAPQQAASQLTQQIADARERALAEQAGLTTERETLQSQIASDIDKAQLSLKQQLESRTNQKQELIDQIGSGAITPEIASMLGLKTFGEELRELSDKNYQDAIARVGQEQLDRYGNTADTYYQKALDPFKNVIDPNSIMLYGVNPQDFLESPSISAMATQEDLARARALQSLENSTAGIAELGITDQGLVGSMTNKLEGTERLQSEIAAARDKLGQELSGEYFSYGSQNPLNFLSQLAAYREDQNTKANTDYWNKRLDTYGNIFDSTLNLPTNAKDGGMKKDPRKEALKRLLRE